MDTTSNENTIVTTKPKSSHLLFLDGIRGLAALWVLLGHTLGVYHQTLIERYTTADVQRLDSWKWLFGWVGYPRDAVAVFILLSGFCLCLPIMRDPKRDLRGGMASYIKRRAWRILPGYFAAFCLAVVIIIGSYRLKSGSGLSDTDIEAYQANINAGSLISHLLLVHNWHPVWNISVLNVLWSVAVEWQIYFLLPLFLLPLWRKCAVRGEGFAACVVVIAGLAFGLAPTFLLPPSYNLVWCHPWFVGVFAMGMAGAWLYVSGSPPSIGTRRLLTGGALCAVALLVFLRSRFPVDDRISEIAIGGVTLALILSSRTGTEGVWWARKALENRSVLWLGMVSYSLYLTHVLWLPRIATLLHRFALTAPLYGVILFVATITVSLCIAYIFYLLFEKPFLAIRQQRDTPPTVASSASAQAAP